MMKSKAIFVVLLSLVSAARSETAMVGSPASMLSRLADENTRVTRVYTFPTLTSEQITVDVEDFYLEAGQLSMVGRAKESKNSDFILKGDAKNLYGWLVLKNRNIAFEYTTDAFGAVRVEQVPVEKIFPVCDFPDEPVPTLQAHSTGVAGPEPHIGPYPAGTPVNKFQSKPGAPRVLYWNISDAPTVWSPADMWLAWQGFAAGYSMFDVNVTTDPDVYNAAPVLNRGSAHQAGSSGTSSCGVNAFGTSRACNIYKKSSPGYQGGTLVHEVGHLLGLSHDGTQSAEYAPGFSAYQWCPIMGSHPTALNWANILWQFSLGEYTGANQKQDDFVVMGRHLPFRADDIAGTQPLILTNGTRVDPALNRGQIGRNTDADVFSFQIGNGGGRVRLSIARTEYAFGSMLDVDASIRNGTGTVLAQNNPSPLRSASFDQNLVAGSYTLTVQGGAEGTPQNGFSNYSSLGFYAIDGDITGVVGIAGKGGAESPIRISPLSADSKLNLDFPASAKLENILLASPGGKILFRSRKKVDFIDLSGLAAGPYVLSVSTDHGTWARNIVKK